MSKGGIVGVLGAVTFVAVVVVVVVVVPDCVEGNCSCVNRSLSSPSLLAVTVSDGGDAAFWAWLL